MNSDLPDLAVRLVVALGTYAAGILLVFAGFLVLCALIGFIFIRRK